MKVYNGIERFKESGVQNTVVTIGVFDGVHFGHRKILNRMQQIATTIQNGGESVLLTFQPHPRQVLLPQQEFKLLNSMEEKQELLSSIGLQHLVVHHFNQEFANMSVKQYIHNVLVDGLRPDTLVIGYDHRFGKDRMGSFHDLEQASKELGFRLEEIPAENVDSSKISSTRIRRALQEGDVTEAARLLGYAYSFTGQVIEGRQIGRNLGFPTANLVPADAMKLLPANGVYAVFVHTKNGKYRGMMNIGTRPSVAPGSDLPSAEVHLLDFNGNLYGEILKVTFVKRLRNEMIFPALEDLKHQLEKDKETVIQILEI